MSHPEAQVLGVWSVGADGHRQGIAVAAQAVLGGIFQQGHQGQGRDGYLAITILELNLQLQGASAEFLQADKSSQMESSWQSRIVF